MLKKLSQQRLILQKTFATKSGAGDKKVDPSIPTIGNSTGKTNLKNAQKTKIPDISSFKFTSGAPNMYELWMQGGNVEDVMEMEYRTYPFEIGHWNPQSPEYVESSRDEERLRKSISLFSKN